MIMNITKEMHIPTTYSKNMMGVVWPTRCGKLRYYHYHMHLPSHKFHPAAVIWYTCCNVNSVPIMNFVR